MLPSDSTDTTYTLVIWEEIPENTTFYLVPNDVLTEEMVGLLSQANGRFVNQDDGNAGLDFVINALSEDPSNCDSTVPKEWHCALAGYKVSSRGDASPIDLGGRTVTRVIQSGFFL